MQSGHIPPIRRTKPKPPSAAAVAVESVQEQILKATSRWEFLAVSRGTNDPAAQLQTARVLHQLVQGLTHHRSACKHGGVRVLLHKQLPPALLMALLSSNQEEVVGLTLSVFQELACIVPAIVPLDAAPKLLQLLCTDSHGAAAARVLTAQLAHWRFSQLWPYWTTAGATAKIFKRLCQPHMQAGRFKVPSSAAAGRAVDEGVSSLLLLAKLVSLAEEQMLLDLAADADTAARWLQLLVLHGKQHWQLAASPSSLQLQDSCCALLAGMSHAPTTSQALAGSRQLRQGVLQVLHGVLRRPCSVSEADAAQITCWMHAAMAASLPVFWQLPQQHSSQQHQQQQRQESGHSVLQQQGQQPHTHNAVLAPHEEHQLLADIATAAAATLCNECFSVTAVAKQVDGAAAGLLACALLPDEGRYGSQRPCTSRFMAAVLGSSCCHVLLHALAVSTNANLEQAAQRQAAATAAASAAAAATAADAAQNEAVGPCSITLVAVQQDLQPEWLLLRMICAQCGAVSAGAEGSSREPEVSFDLGNNSSKSSGVVQPEQVLRVVQAYCSHISSGADTHRVWGVLRSLRFLMCQAVLSVQPHAGQHRPHHDVRRQGQHQHDQHHQQRQQLQWTGLASNGVASSSSSCSSNDAEGVHHLKAGGQQLLQTAGGLLDVIISDSGHHASPASISSSTSTHQLIASVYVSLAIAVYLQDRNAPSGSLEGGAAESTEVLSPADCCLALSALQLAAAALKLLLPVLAGPAPSATKLHLEQQPVQPQTPLPLLLWRQRRAGRQQQQALIVPVHDALACCLAAVQALASLAALIQPALPGMLQECISISNTMLGHRHPACTSQTCGHLRLSAAKAAVTGAVAALDAHLQQQLSQVVLSWQTELSPNRPTGRPAAAPGQAALRQHLQQELRCWAAAALVSCYGQLGARSWQGSVLKQFRAPEPAFSDVHMQLGENGSCVEAHAAVLAAACPVLRQQLYSTAKACASVSAPAEAASGQPAQQEPLPHGHRALLVKLSSAVDTQALHYALDFIYTGAAVLPEASLTSQLQLCCTCLDLAALSGSSRLPHQKLLAAQQQQLGELCESQQAAKQQLHKLGMLARKLQLPLLTAVTRSSRPQPGQRLPDVHLSFDALLPQHLLISTDSGQQLGAGHASQAHLQQQQQQIDGTDQQQQQQLVQQPLEDAVKQESPELQVHGSPAAQAAEQEHVQADGSALHDSSAAYLDMLSAAAAATEGDAAAFRWVPDRLVFAAAGSDLSDKHGDVQAQLQGQGQTHEGLAGGATSFADVYLAAPVVMAKGQCTATTSTCGCCHCQATQQLDELHSPHHRHHDHDQQQLPQQQQQQQPVLAYLPAHRVMLSACCAYFEALLSERWQHEQVHNEQSCTQHNSQLLPPCQQQQQQVRPARVVAVPEADIHVAAALQHYLYTGTLCVSLPKQVLLAGPSTAAGAELPAPQREGNNNEVAAAARNPSQAIFSSGAACGVVTEEPGSSHCPQDCQCRACPPQASSIFALNGCCRACHAARTLLRLWRCAELLLLPELQALCLAAVDAAAWQLGLRCCLVLLMDCCQLGVAAAADGLLAALAHRADRDAATELPEWAELPSGLQTVLIKAWADRMLQQTASSEDRPTAHAAASATLLPAGPASAAALEDRVSGAFSTLQAHCEGQNEAVVVPGQCMEALRAAAEALGSVVNSQLPGHNGA